MIHKRVVCVIGMHRSGTSAITRALNIMGIPLGEIDKLMEPGEDNPTGYWENTEIVNLHDELLQHFSKTWESPQPLPDYWWYDDEISPFRNRLTEIILKNLSNHPIWMWKDPRTSLLIPLWLDILINLNITPLFVICVRNPLDVYHSLERRNGFSKEKACQLWNLYTLSCLYWTNHEKRTIVHYDALFSDIKGTLKKISNELMIAYPYRIDEVLHQLQEFLDPNLRHSYSTVDQLLQTEGILTETKTLYCKLTEVLKNSSINIEDFVNELYIKLPKYE